MLFTKTSEKKRLRTMFGKDDSRILSLELDNSEIHYNYYDKKRFFNLEIGLIKDSEKEKSVVRITSYNVCYTKLLRIE